MLGGNTFQKKKKLRLSIKTVDDNHLNSEEFCVMWMGIGIGVIFILFCISLPFLLFVIFAIRKIIICWKMLYIDFSSQFSSWF